MKYTPCLEGDVYKILKSFRKIDYSLMHLN